MNTFKKITISSFLILSPGSYTPSSNNNLYNTLSYQPLSQELDISEITPQKEKMIIADTTLTTTTQTIAQDTLSILSSDPITTYPKTHTDSASEDYNNISKDHKPLYSTLSSKKHHDDTLTTLPWKQIVWSPWKDHHSQTYIANEKILLDKKKYFKPVIDSIVVPWSIKFNTEYMQKNIYNLLESCFSITDSELIFQQPSLQEQETIYTRMDNIKAHIKSHNWPLVKIFLGKRALRNFIKDEFETIYRILIEQNNLYYEWWKEQFREDFNSIINIYR